MRRNVTPDKMANTDLSKTLSKMSKLAIPCHGGDESVCGLEVDEAEALLGEAARRIAEVDTLPKKLKPNEETHEFVGCIIEIFEEFLEERGIDVPNDEKQEDSDASTIYGSDYGELEDAIAEFLARNGYIEEDSDV